MIGIVGVAVIAGGVFASIRYSQRDIVTVQTGKVIQEDLASVVTASGTINPKTYINIGAQYQGQITDIYVKEGDHVHKGQLLAKVDSAQSAADVVAQQAALSSAEADANAAEEGIKAGQDNITTLQATLNRT
ncbi:MAG TPA: biotin/lipoyl-containing protein, partial [Bryobacteraceae bacterium]|nr:biotin/lipoyl-containing protein [Bryobacteraceae bacterium]